MALSKIPSPPETIVDNAPLYITPYLSASQRDTKRPDNVSVVRTEPKMVSIFHIIHPYHGTPPPKKKTKKKTRGILDQ